ncbi:CBS domain-containing protein, partial [Achromobacter xylosoxidans]
PFDLLRASQVMTTPVQTLPDTLTVAQAIAHFTTAQPVHTSYPVIDAEGVAVGEVTRADSLAWALEPARQEQTLAQALRGRELVYGYPEELASQIADRMALSGAGRVPILERGTGRVLGIVGRKDLFRSRARRLREESERAAFLRRAPSSGG